MLKYSRQREAIKTFLAGRYDHPTAETVYLGIKEEFPNISLGTVYRNLTSVRFRNYRPVSDLTVLTGIRLYIIILSANIVAAF